MVTVNGSFLCVGRKAVKYILDSILTTVDLRNFGIKLYRDLPLFQYCSAVGGNIFKFVITIENITGAEGQRWKLIPNGSSFILENGYGMRLTTHRANSSPAVTAQTTASVEQLFNFNMIDFPYYKITCARSSRYALDLTNSNTAPGTKVDLWLYTDNTDMPVHRQWMLVPIPKDENLSDGIEMVDAESLTKMADGMYDIQGRKIKNGQEHFRASGTFDNLSDLSYL